MRILGPLVWMIAVQAAGQVAPQGDKAEAEKRLAALERFGGEWSVDGKWADGTPLHARSVMAWSLGKKIMTSTSRRPCA